MSEEEKAMTRQHTRDQLAKLLLGTATAFIATKLVEATYDTLMAKRRAIGVTTDTE